MVASLVAALFPTVDAAIAGSGEPNRREEGQESNDRRKGEEDMERYDRPRQHVRRREENRERRAKSRERRERVMLSLYTSDSGWWKDGGGVIRTGVVQGLVDRACANRVD